MNKKSEIEDSMLSGGKSSSLTSDLPIKNRKQKGAITKNLTPAIVIILAGVATFIGTTFYQNANKKSLGAAKDNGDWLQQNGTYNPVDEQLPPSDPEPEPVYVTKTFATVKTNEVGYLNVRADATTSAERLGQLDIGDKLEVLAEQPEWVEIKLNEPLGGETTGWVAKSYVEITTESVQVE